MATTSIGGSLTESDLLLRGFFHNRMIPPLSTLFLEPALPDLIGLARSIMSEAGKKNYHGCIPVRSRCIQHSIPKRKHLRRILSIPNPFHQSILCCEVVDNWDELLEKCRQSTVSLSVPRISVKRALEAEQDRRRESIERARRSIGARYVLKTDLSRFYPSIYTHSIPWAIHGKEAARRDTRCALFGNRLDLWLRETQDRQTGGIPIGPDTSYLFAEVIASALDTSLQSAFLSQLRGTRYIDDYNLYFRSLSDAERALAVLHGAARQYELDINDLKTEILELPEPLEPHWKTQLRSMELKSNDGSTSLKALFDRGSELAKQYPHDSILTYVAKKVLNEDWSPDEWGVLEVLLLRAALGEPSMLQQVLEIYQKHGEPKSDALEETIESICQYHSALQQSSEVAWALWIARIMEVSVSKETAQAVTQVDDDVVALVALDMISKGLMPSAPTPLWENHMHSEGLYSDHWLLAYEAYEQGWLRPTGDGDYIGGDQYGCFDILRRHGVRFYDVLTEWEGGYLGYSDEAIAVDVETGKRSPETLAEPSGMDETTTAID